MKRNSGLTKRTIGSRLTAAFLAASAAPCLAAHARFNLQQPNSQLGQDIYDLHTLIMWVCVIIFVGVFGVMCYAIVKHRKSVGHQAAHFHENTTVEVVWTVIPFLILIGIAIPATKTLIHQRDTSGADITIKVTGYQWKWGYQYLTGEGEGISFFSMLATPREQISGSAPKGEHYLLEVDQPLVVPVGRKVRMVVTAADVLHAWWVPSLAAKQDAIPGFVRATWFKAEREGVYRGQCAELCGKEHGFMPIVVHVLSAEKYAQWVSEHKPKTDTAAVDVNKTWTLEELVARGEKVFAQNCVACHQANGMGIPGTFPALNGSAVVKGPKAKQLDTVLHGVVLDGKPTAMQSFAHLSDVELAAVVTYTRNAWNNKSGEAVTPADVKAARSKSGSAAAPAGSSTVASVLHAAR
ncbi:MAG: cytochrome c oxidase subunit II [Burkholderiales bacterium]|nr:cytochrome c oxidase subunit II [Burkholderiales bacterium]